ncbi:NAD(P)/FAD-dependent oxidoreductase [Kineococcus sp. TBRC 1896]|uniref:NAD(P)/FAD-dependent oxidoreductase n=1 Tax=Kineococcus mangrovi TaxID=1660183 RepID=A0ABV4I3A7_9ACTN
MSAVDPTRPVLVVGAGISGASCARALSDAGVPVRVLDRGRRSGGRMSGRRVESAGDVRVVDLGASYFTVSGEGDLHDDFARLVAGWQERGLARPWTDTFAVLDGSGGEPGSSSGPVRWAAPTGLRSLVEDLVAQPGAAPLDVVHGIDVESVSSGEGGPGVDGRGAPAVVLAMPDPQAADLLPRMAATRLDVSARWNWRPCIAVYAGWEQRWWPDFHGAFVNDSDLLVFLADDGSRRGDGAPVLVAHTAPDVSSEHLDAPASVVAPVLASLGPMLGVAAAPEPTWARAHRWSLASPLRQHEDAPFGWDEESGIGVCGDAWGERSKVQTAWESGTALGRHLAERFAG